MFGFTERKEREAERYMEEERDESIATVLRLRLGWIVFKEDR